MVPIYFVILAGGSGSRLWPLSRDGYPKQILNFDDKETLFRQAFLRAASVADDKNILAITNVKHASAIKTQLNELQKRFSRKNEYKILTEPVSKNTAPALSVATKYIQEELSQNEETIIVAIPSDHVIPNREYFSEIIEKGIGLANSGYIVSFSEKEEIIDENFGYLSVKKNQRISKIEKIALKVSSFIEKPDKKIAEENLGNEFYKNTGIYMFNIKTYFKELKKHCPDIFNILKKNEIKSTIPSIPLSVYELMPAISIDYALMEKTEKLVTIPFDTEWKDIGSWNAVYELSKKDKKGNCFIGKAIDLGSENSLVFSNSKLVATLGLKDKVVVETEDAILVSNKDNSTGIKNIYSKLNGKNSLAKEIHKTVFRPWGYYTVLEEGKGFLMKCIVVHPNAKLSLQLHYHRSEHWVVVEGVATVIRGEETYTLEAGNSIDIAVEEIHSLQNYTDMPVKILEVQQGDILDENDIERIEDIYGRA